MRALAREGSVVLRATVDVTGRVVPGSIRVIRSSHYEFQAPAIAMLYGSRFRPAEEDGRAVEALVQMPVQFETQGAGTVTPADSAAADSVLAEARLLVRDGQVPEAMIAFTRAQSLDSRVAEAGSFWSPLCWYGSLWGYASEVMSACDRLVSLGPSRVDWRDARGVARTLAGNFRGAITDFEVVVEYTLSDGQRTERRAWITALRRGRNPLTQEILRALRRRGS
jgi:TonB family protein